MRPSPFEYLAEHEVLLVISSIVIGFAVIGVFAAVEEIRIKVMRRRYRKARDERRGSKWTKKSRNNSGRIQSF